MYLVITNLVRSFDVRRHGVDRKRRCYGAPVTGVLRASPGGRGVKLHFFCRETRSSEHFRCFPSRAAGAEACSAGLRLRSAGETGQSAAPLRGRRGVCLVFLFYVGRPSAGAGSLRWAAAASPPAFCFGCGPLSSFTLTETSDPAATAARLGFRTRRSRKWALEKSKTPHPESACVRRSE